MADLYYPDADHRVQNFEGAYPSSTKRVPDKWVIHTTEGAGWPSYSGGKSAPHMTGMLDHDNQRIVWRQHFAANRYARALRDAPGGVKTNVGEGEELAWQTELIGTAGWATPENPTAQYHVATVIPEQPDWVWRELGKVAAWLHEQFGMPLTAVEDTFPAWDEAGGHRMTPQQWADFRGICGHMHVPENDHSDPGAIPAHKIVAEAKRLTGGGVKSAASKPAGRVWVTPQGDDPAYLREGMAHPKVAEVQAWLSDRYDWAADILKPAGGADDKYGAATTQAVAGFQEHVTSIAKAKGWPTWTYLEVDGKWGPDTERAAEMRGEFRKSPAAPVRVLSAGPGRPVYDVPAYPHPSKLHTDAFWAQLEEIAAVEGYSVNCGPSDAAAGRCTPKRHPHSKNPPSRHFKARAIDYGRNPSSGAPVSRYEQAYLSAVGFRLRDLYPDMGLVLMRGPGDHENHLHAQDTPNSPGSFRPDLSGAPAGILLYGMGSEALSSGFRRDEVKELQRALGVEPDGSFRIATFDALRGAQAEHGLVVDGIAGPATLAKIGA